MFKLYPEERHWWSFSDYRAVLDVVRGLCAPLAPKRGITVLEFGPGSSTLALIEGGAANIDTCEDDPHWADVYRDRLVRDFPFHVTLHVYAWSNRITIPGVDERTYDLALIDGPLQPGRRLAALNYALQRCEHVLVPIDEAKGIVRRVEELQRSKTHTVVVRETGPLAGSFALISRQPAAGSSVGD